MRTIILSLSMLLVLGSTTAFADDATGLPVERSFQKQFRGAEQVKWSLDNGYDKATFVLGGHRTIAWFEPNGNLLGTVRDLLYNQLPLVVMSSLDKRFGEAIVFDVREISNDDGTHYKLTLENEGKKYDVSVYSNGNIESVKKLKK